METTTQQVETVLAQWQEPSESDALLAAYSPGLIILGAALLCLSLVGLGLWQHSYSYYVAAAVAGFGGFALVMQRRMPSRQLSVTVSDQRLQAGTKSYALADLAGFWLDEQDGNAVVNLEPRKAAMLPITVIFPGAPDEARSVLNQVLAELEPRQKTVTDSLSRYIRF